MWWQQTAAGQGLEGEGRKGQFPALEGGALGSREPNSLHPLTPSVCVGGEHLKKLLFLGSSAIPPHPPVFPITSTHRARNCPATTGKVLLPQAEWSQAPRHRGGPGLSMMPSGPDLGSTRQDSWMPVLSPQKAWWQVPGTGAGALVGHVQQL